MTKFLLKYTRTMNPQEFLVRISLSLDKKDLFSQRQAEEYHYLRSMFTGIVTIPNLVFSDSIEFLIRKLSPPVKKP